MKKKEKEKKKTTVPSDIVRAWEIEANKNWTPKNVPIGVLCGGCPKCGHMCSYESDKGLCYKCGWNYRKVKGFQPANTNKVKNLVK